MCSWWPILRPMAGADGSILLLWLRWGSLRSERAEAREEARRESGEEGGESARDGASRVQVLATLYQYKSGDLQACNVNTNANPSIYAQASMLPPSEITRPEPRPSPSCFLTIPSTISAIAREDVRPGDSIPARLMKPGSDCEMEKSTAEQPLADILGRIPTSASPAGGQRARVARGSTLLLTIWLEALLGNVGQKLSHFGDRQRLAFLIDRQQLLPEVGLILALLS